MFGYVQIRKPELKIKDYDTYRSFYCGLCSVLKDNYGILGEVTLTYDMTFLIILLSSVYDLSEIKREERCIVHPAKKHKVTITVASEYAAHMNIILSYYHLIDDLNDEDSKKAYVGSKLYTSHFKKAVRRYPKKAELIRRGLNKLSELESVNAGIDELSDAFGKIMTVLFNYKKDAFSDYLKGLGYHLGRFIYIMDAYDDLEDDIKKGCFNPLTEYDGDVTEYVEKLLYCEISEAASYYRALPSVEYNDILGNIIYAGVWNRFDRINADNKQRS